VQVEQPIVRGCRIDFEIASMDQDSQWRVNRQRHAIDETVSHLYWIDRERPDLEALTRLDLVEFRVIQQAVFFQLPFDIGQRKLGAVDRDIQFRQDPRQRSNMVLVAMRQHDGAHVLAVLRQIGDIGDNDIDTQQFGFRKHQAGVDHNDVISPANGHAVHAKFAESTQGHNL